MGSYKNHIDDGKGSPICGNPWNNIRYSSVEEWRKDKSDVCFHCLRVLVNEMLNEM